MDPDAIRKSLERIVSDNQRARSQAQQRASRLMDVLSQGDRDKFTETVNDILDDATGGSGKNGEVLGEDGKTKPTDGSADVAGP